MKHAYGIKMQMELAELFRFTVELRGDTAEIFAEKYGTNKDVSLEWVYGIGLTERAVELMQEYVSSNIKCLMAFIEQFKATHRIATSMLKSFVAQSNDRYVKRREYKESMTLLKRFYSLLNEYEKKYLLRGYDAYIKFETNINTIDLIFCNNMTKYKTVDSLYQLAYMRAKNEFNALLELYGVSDRIVGSEDNK